MSYVSALGLFHPQLRENPIIQEKSSYIHICLTEPAQSHRENIYTSYCASHTTVPPSLEPFENIHWLSGNKERNIFKGTTVESWCPFSSIKATSERASSVQ